jgi:hypothetical protein
MLCCLTRTKNPPLFTRLKELVFFAVRVLSWRTITCPSPTTAQPTSHPQHVDALYTSGLGRSTRQHNIKKELKDKGACQRGSARVYSVSSQVLHFSAQTGIAIKHAILEKFKQRQKAIQEQNNAGARHRSRITIWLASCRLEAAARLPVQGL